MNYDYDLFTIGAGSGGVRASRMATQYGATAAVAEMGPLGGTCVNVGCVPKKLLVYASHFHEEFRAAAGFGWLLGEALWPPLEDVVDGRMKRDARDARQRVLDRNPVLLAPASAMAAPGAAAGRGRGWP